MGPTKSQLGVGMGALPALLLTIGAFVSPVLPQVSAGPDAHIALWLSCSMVCALCLLASIGRLGNHRFVTPADIDGSGIRPNTPHAAMLQAVLQNTLEQVVLAIITYGVWIWLGPPDRIGLVIIYASFFAVGRLCFFIGYQHGAPARAFGFGFTFYPTVFLLFACVPSMVSRLGLG